MARDEFEEPRRKKSSTLFSSRNLFIFLFVLGLALGLFLEHRYIEPILSKSEKQLASCESTNKLLNTEIESCYKKLADANKQSNS